MMSNTFQSINQRIIDDLRKSRGEIPDDYVPTVKPARRDADDDATEGAYSSEGSVDDEAPEAPDAQD